MAHQFLSIKEAVRDYIVSETTLRRRAREIVRDSAHQFRQLVRPTPSEYEQLKEQHAAFEYQFSTQLLDMKYEQRSGTDEKAAAVGETRVEVSDAAMGMLQQTQGLLKDELREAHQQVRELNDQLRAKDRHLEAKDDQLKRRDDEIERRSREAQDLNLSIRTLSLSLNEMQKRLPSSGHDQAAVLAVSADGDRDQNVKKRGGKGAPKRRADEKATAAKEKRGVLGRWLGGKHAAVKSQ